MNIGFVNEYFPPFAPGGAEWSTFLLAQRLATSERVVVITPNYGTEPYQNMDGVIVERFAMPFRLRQGQRTLSYGYLANPLFYSYMATQVVRQVWRHRLDILHAHNKQSIVGTTLAGWITRVPVVVSLRDLMALCRYGMCLNDFDKQPRGCDWASYRHCVREYVDRYMPNIGWLRRAAVLTMAVYHRFDTFSKRAALGRASAIITPSDKIKCIYVSRGIDADKILTVYNPAPQIDLPSDQRAGDWGEYRIVYAGKLSWGKGPHLLVEALPAIAALAGKPIRVTLAGQGPLSAYLEERVYELGFKDQVRFAGQLPRDDLQKLYWQADVVVVPSVVQESFGRVALEALMSGVPVVVSNHGGLPEIVEDGVTGLVVEPEPRALADAIVRVLQSTRFRSQVRDALPMLRQKFGQDVTKLHLELYSGLLRRTSQSPASRVK